MSSVKPKDYKGLWYLQYEEAIGRANAMVRQQLARERARISRYTPRPFLGPEENPTPATGGARSAWARAQGASLYHARMRRARASYRG